MDGLPNKARNILLLVFVTRQAALVLLGSVIYKHQKCTSQSQIEWFHMLYASPRYDTANNHFREF